MVPHMVPNCFFRRTCVKKVPKSSKMYFLHQKGAKRSNMRFFVEHVSKRCQNRQTCVFFVKKVPKRWNMRFFRRKCIKKVAKSSKMCFRPPKRCPNGQKCIVFLENVSKRCQNRQKCVFFVKKNAFFGRKCVKNLPYGTIMIPLRHSGQGYQDDGSFCGPFLANKKTLALRF